MSRPWVPTSFSPGPQPTSTEQRADEQAPNRPIGFTTTIQHPEAEPLTWEGDNT